MLNRNDHVPLYYQLKTFLLGMISDLKADDPIPGELELANRFDVSRGTVKQAVMDLVHEGILYRIQGKGTFVSPPKVKRTTGTLPTFTDDIRRLGQEPKSKLLSFKVMEAPDFIAEKLQLGEDRNVIRFKRTVLLKDKPFAIVTSYLRHDVYPNLKAEHIGDSLYDSLAQLHAPVPIKAHDTYTPLNAEEKLATILGVKTGVAIFYSERIAYLDSDLPVEFVESYIRGDRFTLDIQFAPDVTNQDTRRGESDVAHFGFGFGNINSKVLTHG